MTGEYKYLLMALMLLFMVGSLTFIASSFTDVSPQNYGGYLSPLVSFIGVGYNFHLVIPLPILPDFTLDFTFNPFGILGGNIQNWMATQVAVIGLLPVFLGLPLIIIISSAFLYFIIKLIQGFIP